MSAFSSQGVGAAACANTEVESPASAATTKTVFVKTLVIIILPAAMRLLSQVFVPSLEQITNGIIPSIATFDASLCPADFVISRARLRDYVPVSGYNTNRIAKNVMGMI